MSRLEPGEQDAARQRDGRFDPHGGVKSREVCAGGPLGIARGLPFEEFSVSHQQAQQGPPDRVEADERVVGKKCQRERTLTELAPPRRGFGPWKILRFAKRRDHRRQ